MIITGNWQGQMSVKVVRGVDLLYDTQRRRRTREQHNKRDDASAGRDASLRRTRERACVVHKLK